MVIYRHKDKYSIREMCRFFEVSRSGYYGYVSRMEVPAWDLPLAENKNAAKPTAIAEYRYGFKGTGFTATRKQYSE